MSQDIANKGSAQVNEKVNVVAPTKQSILERVRRNIAILNEAKKNSGGNFMKIQSGETKILQFTGDMEPVQRTFKRKNEQTGKEEESTKTMYSYKVLDMKKQEEGIKAWEVSRTWSDNINNLLDKEFLTLEVKRTGASNRYVVLIRTCGRATVK